MLDLENAKLYTMLCIRDGRQACRQAGRPAAARGPSGQRWQI